MAALARLGNFTRSRPRTLILGLVVVVALGFFLFRPTDKYKLDVVLPVADGLFDGARVMMHGEKVGDVESVDLKDGRALVRITVNGDAAPVPAGTTARISWSSVVGARTLDLIPGPSSAPDLTSGKMITSNAERVELDDVLATLDAPTRKKVSALVASLNTTIKGSETDLNDTLRTLGPTMEALGEVLHGVAADGPALRDLVTRLRQVTTTLDSRDTALRASIDNLDALTGTIASRQASLREVVAQLPATIDEAVDTLDRVPGAVDATVPLLHELRPATRQLPAVARQLSPVLTDLRPTLNELRPAVSSLSSLLEVTPDLLTTSHATVPRVDAALTTLNPAIDFLRPYTPELVGWLTNWTSLFAGQTSGNYAPALITASASSLNVNPGVVPPGMNQDNTPAPGAIIGQPWTDANGDELR